MGLGCMAFRQRGRMHECEPLGTMLDGGRAVPLHTTRGQAQSRCFAAENTALQLEPIVITH